MEKRIRRPEELKKNYSREERALKKGVKAGNMNKGKSEEGYVLKGVERKLGSNNGALKNSRRIT